LNHGTPDTLENDNHQEGGESAGITPADRIALAQDITPPWTAEFWVWRPTIEEDAAQKLPVR
jgi:hypothetical protein